MSEVDDQSRPDRGHRKDGKPYKEGNTAADGSYIVGRNRTSEATKFRANDGRPRGRRKKGVENHDTFFERELQRKVKVREDGKERTVTKSQGVDLRTISLAASGELKAIEMVDKRRERIAARKEAEMRQNRSLPDQEMLDRYIRQRLAERDLPPADLGDPPPDPKEPDAPSPENAGGTDDD